MIKSFVKYCLILLVVFLSAKSQLFANTTLTHDFKSAGNQTENLLDDQNTALHLFTSCSNKSIENLHYTLVETIDNYEEDSNDTFKKLQNHGKNYSFLIFNKVVIVLNSDTCKLICDEFEFKKTLENRNLLFQVFRI
jgi:hypothetical protein